MLVLQGICCLCVMSPSENLAKATSSPQENKMYTWTAKFQQKWGGAGGGTVRNVPEGHLEILRVSGLVDFRGHFLL